MSIEPDSEGNLGLSMKVATDAVDAEARFLVVIHMGELGCHCVMGMDLDEAGLIGGAMITIARVNRDSGADLIRDVEVPLGVIGEMKQAFEGFIRRMPGGKDFVEHVCHERRWDAGDVRGDLWGEGG